MRKITKLCLHLLKLFRENYWLLFFWTRCKLIFGLMDLKLSDFFSLHNDIRNRGHQCKLYLPGCSSSARHNFFTYRAARIWNDLPVDTDFSSLNTFKRSLSLNF